VSDHDRAASYMPSSSMESWGVHHDGQNIETQVTGLVSESSCIMPIAVACSHNDSVAKVTHPKAHGISVDL